LLNIVQQRGRKLDLFTFSKDLCIIYAKLIVVGNVEVTSLPLSPSQIKLLLPPPTLPLPPPSHYNIKKNETYDCLIRSRYLFHYLHIDEIDELFSSAAIILSADASTVVMIIRQLEAGRVAMIVLLAAADAAGAADDDDDDVTDVLRSVFNSVSLSLLSCRLRLVLLLLLAQICDVTEVVAEGINDDGNCSTGAATARW
uniref:Myosin motor domain-containing protein n=1 Tax=Enterobius vermicularis TaxID=51028 RepID=A0A0N4V355_ENTVE